MKPVIETHDLCKSYNGRTVVDHLNLTVPQGCVYGFLGPNGAGKSTSMKMLLGLVHPTGGSVELLGHTMNETNRIPLLRQTGSLIESPSGYLHLTARENLAIVADLKGVAHKDIDRVLEIVHLTADAHRKVGQYSLGMKQRLGIAMALQPQASDPGRADQWSGPGRHSGNAQPDLLHAGNHRGNRADLQPPIGRDRADGHAGGHPEPRKNAV